MTDGTDTVPGGIAQVQDHQLLRPARWFYRERDNDGVWIPFSSFDSDQIEASQRQKQETLFLPGQAQRRICIKERLLCDEESGTQTQLLRGTWFFSRSDKLLQPYAETLAQRLDESLHHACQSGHDMRTWSFDVGVYCVCLDVH